MSKKLNIAFILRFDPRDKKTLSGTPYYMLKSLEKEYGTVDVLGPFKGYVFFRLFFGFINKYVLPLFASKTIDYSHSTILSKMYSYYFGKKLKQKKYDVAFAPMASSEIANIKTKVPIIYISDATFHLMQDYYSRYSSLFNFSKKQAHKIEKQAMLNSSFSVFSSEWAINSACSYYGINGNKTQLIPFGANMDEYPEAEVINEKFENTEQCNLLFLGVDWQRKGGDIAFNTFLTLKEKGTNVKLTVCGCIPPVKYNDQDLLVIPFLNKNLPEDNLKFQQMLKENHFLLLPTRAECTPISFCEANAYGLPVITTDTGGVASVITEGLNGYVLGYDDKAEEYAKVINNIWKDKNKYKELVCSSRLEFENRLNWEKWTDSMSGLVGTLIEQ